MNQRTLAVMVAAGAFFLTACAGKKPAPPPPYNPAAAAEAQAASFIEPAKNAGKHMAEAKKLAITSCNVMFAQTSSASASTGGGLFSEVGSEQRVEAKVSVYYTLTGITDKDMQRMTNEICAASEAKLKAAGFDLVDKSVLAKNTAYIELQKAGRASPFEYKGGAGGAQSAYKVFAPNGSTVFDERYIGSVSGLGQAFKAAKGTSAAQYEARIMDELGADAANINILVDFAELQSSGQGAAGGGLVNRDRAEVKSEVGLSVSGQLRVKIAEGMKCWNRFGKRECGVDMSKWPTFSTKRPVTTGDKFYKSVKEVTTTGDKVGSALVTGLAMLGGGTKLDITRYNVDVDAKTFEKVSRVNIDGFLDMAAISAKKSATAKK
jgi:PBP1b-binding outer membrane lipoprotein LpoB